MKNLLGGSILWRENESGMILVTAILFSFIIAIFSTALYASSISGRRGAEFQTNRIIAFHMAETGTDQAITQLASNPNYTGTTTPVSLGGGMYSVTVTQPDTTNNPNVRKIVSSGFAPDNVLSSYAYQSRVVTTYFSINPQAVFAQAVFGANKIVLQNSASIDSYNSALGAYGGTNVSAGGNVVGNTIKAGNIDLNGTSQINGNVTCGPSGDPSTVISVAHNAVITGTKTAAQTAMTYAAVTVPNGIASGGDLTIHGNNVIQLSAGTYWYTDISISGNGQLKLLGPVTIYVTGDSNIQGKGVITSGDLPANFALNVVGDKNVTISPKNQPFYGVIYAPEAGKNNNGVRLSGSTTNVYGAVIAYEFRASNSSKLHFDEALLSQGGGSSNQMTMVSWQES